MAARQGPQRPRGQRPAALRSLSRGRRRRCPWGVLSSGGIVCGHHWRLGEAPPWCTGQTPASRPERAEPEKSSPPPEAGVLGRVLLHRLVHGALHVVLRVADGATGEREAGY